MVSRSLKEGSRLWGCCEELRDLGHWGPSGKSKGAGSGGFPGCGERWILDNELIEAIFGKKHLKSLLSIVKNINTFI